MEAKHTMLLYYCETRRLSHAKVLHRAFELEETSMFLSDSNSNDDENLFYIKIHQSKE
jgi:hypothetical protein